MATSAKARYTALRTRRESFLRRARSCAALTLPWICPPEGFNGTQLLPQPYQGLGARLVVNLASRLMTGFLPPGEGFFKLSVSPAALMAEGQTSEPPDLQHNLALTEKTIHAEVERRQWRQPTFISAQHLIVTGNVMEQMLPDNRIRVFPLDRYVVVRDPAGTMTEFVIEECLAPSSVPEDLQGMLPKPTNDYSNTDTIHLYTWGKIQKNGSWKVHQELNEQVIKKSTGTFRPGLLPFFALRWTAVAGEDYGRGKVEEHEPDLRALDGLEKATLDGAAMASRNITMIRPNAAGGLNLRRKLARANNGDLIVGNMEDVGMLQFTNVNGLQVGAEKANQLRQELGAAFLLFSASNRDAERVTAEEVRRVAEELEGTLGGVYSMLAQEMILARIRRLILQMQSAGQLPEWPEGIIEPTILTGLEALGRSQDVSRVATILQMLAALPTEIVMDYPKWPTILTMLFNGAGIPDAVNDTATVQQQQQQRAQMEAIAKAMGQAGQGQGAPPQ